MDDQTTPTEHPAGTGPAPAPRTAWRRFALPGAVAGALVVGAGIAAGGAASPVAAVTVAQDEGTTTAGDDAAPDGEGTDTGDATDCGPGGRGGPGGPGGRGASGTVTAVDGSTLTVEGRGGTTSVVTTDETVVREAVDGTLDDVAVGDSVVVRGVESAAGTLAAVAVSDVTALAPSADDDAEVPGRPEGAGRRGVIGEVSAVDGPTLTVTTLDGTSVSVRTADDTTFRVVEVLELADVEVGDAVRVRGERADDGTVTAISMALGDLDVAGGPGGPAGGPGRPGPAGDDATADDGTDAGGTTTTTG